MEQLIEKLKAVLGDILRIKTSLDVERGKVAEVDRKQSEVAKVQDSRATSLDDREAAVKSIEDIVIYKTAAEEVAKASDQGRIALENAKNAFEAYKKDESAKIRVRKEEVNKSEELYKRELEALKKAKEDVEKEMVNVKGKVLDGLTKNL